MNKALFIFSAVLVFYSIGVAECKTQNNTDSLFDVFPLKPGIRYSYLFNSYDNSSDETVFSSSKDSGQVDYIVIDSTNSKDSTILWSILEIHNFRSTRTVKYLSSHDTIYYVKDSIQFTLNENKFGRHEITCLAKIWNFPLKQLRGQINVSVFRYFDTSEARMTWQWQNKWIQGVRGSGSDTLFLSISSGFSRRHFNENWTSGYMSGNSNLTIQSLHNPTDVSKEQVYKPEYIHLEQNFPNPFNPTTTFAFHLKNNEYTSLKLFNVLGEEISVIKEGFLFSGEHTVEWNASNLASGIYFYKLQTKNFSETKKLLLLK
jgi:hypothetical protein